MFLTNVYHARASRIINFLITSAYSKLKTHDLITAVGI